MEVKKKKKVAYKGNTRLRYKYLRRPELYCTLWVVVFFVHVVGFMANQVCCISFNTFNTPVLQYQFETTKGRCALIIQRKGVGCPS